MECAFESVVSLDLTIGILLRRTIASGVTKRNLLRNNKTDIAKEARDGVLFTANICSVYPFRVSEFSFRK